MASKVLAVATVLIRSLPTRRTPSWAHHRTMSLSTESPKVNLLDLAAACVACTEAAARAIQKIAEPPQTTDNASDTTDHAKNTRLKADGSCVTDADFAAQGIIVQAVRAVSPDVRIVGEESAEEMAAHVGRHEFVQDVVLQRTRQEMRLRYYHEKTQVVSRLPLSQGIVAAVGDSSDAEAEALLRGHLCNRSRESTATPSDDVESNDDDDAVFVDASRVGVIVDPLDGTKAYTNCEYDAVSILICITLDYQPYFGVIGKPFGYNNSQQNANLTSMLDTKCVVVYGGPLLKGVYLAGGRTIEAAKVAVFGSDNVTEDDLPRAVISSSRSKGVVQDFCTHLAENRLIHKEPLLISGAGEKSMRLILQVNNEALWFFPKSGTSLWDVAAPDALLRSLGGKLTDKFGNLLDYSKPRTEAENMQGVVACIDTNLHDKCIALFKEGDWVNRI